MTLNELESLILSAFNELPELTRMDVPIRRIDRVMSDHEPWRRGPQNVPTGGSFLWIDGLPGDPSISVDLDVDTKDGSCQVRFELTPEGLVLVEIDAH